MPSIKDEMSENTRLFLVALIAGLPAILAAFQSYKNGQDAHKNERQAEARADDLNRKARLRSKKLIQVVGKTNGNGNGNGSGDHDNGNARIAALDQQLAEALLILAELRRELAETRQELNAFRTRYGDLPKSEVTSP